MSEPSEDESLGGRAQNDRAPSRLHVMHVLTRVSHGGAGPHLLSSTRDLQEMGFQVQLASGRPGAYEGSIQVEAVPHIDLPRMKREISPADDLASFRDLKRIFKRNRPDIVHTHQAKAGLIGRLAARRTGVPAIVHTFHGHVLNNYFSAPISQAFALAERRLAKITDACIAVSNSVRDDLLGRGVGTPTQWHVIPIGLDAVDLLGEIPDPRGARMALGLPQAGPLIGSVGRLVPIKDLDTFIDAAAILQKQRPDAHFVIAGEGELRSQVELRAKRILGDSVSILGWVTDLSRLYAAIDVVVLTSLNEGTPAALIEAGAVGVPVVATQVGGVSDVVIDNVTGFLIPRTRDPKDIAARVMQLLDDPARARHMGDSAREVVRARFSQERMIRDLSALYDNLWAQKRPPKGQR